MAPTWDVPVLFLFAKLVETRGPIMLFDVLSDRKAFLAHWVFRHCEIYGKFPKGAPTWAVPGLLPLSLNNHYHVESSTSYHVVVLCLDEYSGDSDNFFVNYLWSTLMVMFFGNALMLNLLIAIFGTIYSEVPLPLTTTT